MRKVPYRADRRNKMRAAKSIRLWRHLPLVKTVLTPKQSALVRIVP